MEVHRESFLNIEEGACPPTYRLHLCVFKKKLSEQILATVFWKLVWKKGWDGLFATSKNRNRCSWKL